MRRLLILSLAAFAMGCEISGLFSVHNNTAIEFLIRDDDEEHTLRPNQTITTTMNSSITATMPGCVLRYEILDFPPSYRQPTRSRRRAQIQVDEMGWLFVLGPEMRPPVDVARLEQPEGWPVKPSLVGTCRGDGK